MKYFKLQFEQNHERIEEFVSFFNSVYAMQYTCENDLKITYGVYCDTSIMNFYIICEDESELLLKNKLSLIDPLMEFEYIDDPLTSYKDEKKIDGFEMKAIENDKDKKKVESDTEFTMSTKDLSLIKYIGEMIDIGIASLKVEGRMRSNYYIATVISTYREAIDEYYNNNLTKDKIEYYSKILNRVANRESTDQFFNKFPGVEGQYFLGRQEVSNQDFLGIVLDYDMNTQMVSLIQKNYFKKGLEVEMFGPNINAFSFIIPDIYDEEGNLLEVANHPEQIVRFKLNKEVYKDDIMRIKFI